MSPQTASDLDLMRKIRNRFAHTHKAIDFIDHKIRGYMSSMASSEKNLLEVLAQDFGLDYSGFFV